MSHIALLAPELEAGGAQRVMLLLGREFVARGHKVDLVLLTANGPLLEAVPHGVQVIELTQASGSGTIFVPVVAAVRLALWLRRERPDALLSTITGTNLLAIIARALSQTETRLVIREAVTLDNVASPQRLRAMRFLYRRADAVVALSDVMATQLQSRIGLDSDKLVSIPNPIDTDMIRRKALASVDHPWTRSSTISMLISVGRLIPQKDHATLVRAFSLLPETLQARLIVVGDGPERERLETLARTLGVLQHIHFVGFDGNPWRWMKRASIFVLSSRWEGHPNVVLEAQALGLPIISTEYDSSIHSLLDTVPGSPYRIVAPARPDSMAEAIIDLLSSGVDRTPEHPQNADNNRTFDSYEELLTASPRSR